MRFLTSAVLLVLLVLSPSAAVETLFVDAERGNDSNPGTADKPFKTLTACLASISETEEVRIQLSAGTYDSEHGEVFPLTLPPGTVLVGASATATVVASSPLRDGVTKRLLHAQSPVHLGTGCRLEDLQFKYVDLLLENETSITSKEIQPVTLQGILIEYGGVRGSNVHIKDCTITDSAHTAIQAGGGLPVSLDRVHISRPDSYILDYPGGSLDVSHCEFIGTATGNGVYIGNGTASIRHTRFRKVGDLRTHGTDISLASCRLDDSALSLSSSYVEIADGVFNDTFIRIGGGDPAESQSLEVLPAKGEEYSIRDSQFTKGGIRLLNVTAPFTLARSEFHNGGRRGLDMADTAGAVFIERCRFRNTGIDLWNTPKVKVDGDGTTPNTDALVRPLVTNSLFFRSNVAVECTDSEVDLVNCTVADNDLAFNLTDPESNIRLRNCIVVSNSEFAQGSTDGLEARFSLVDEPLPGVGNIVALDAGFVDPSSFDYHLQEGSSAVDAGEAIDWLHKDFEGNSRPLGAGHDIGAYEFVPSDTVVTQWMMYNSIVAGQRR